MTPSEYINKAIRTNSAMYNLPVVAQMEDIIHAAIGIATEAGEFLDPIKKFIFYGKPVDFVNLDEEVGDLLWYIALYLNARGLDMEAVMEKNINKLEARYPDKFTQDHALNRDLDAEREILER